MEPSQLGMLYEWLQQLCAMQCMQTELIAVVKHDRLELNSASEKGS